MPSAKVPGLEAVIAAMEIALVPDEEIVPFCTPVSAETLARVTRGFEPEGPAV